MFDPGRNTEVTVEGKRWTVGRLTRSVIFAFRDWCREQTGDPFAHLDRLKGLLPPEELLARVKAAEAVAKDLAQFSLGTATAKAYLATELGLSKLVHLLLVEHHPSATEDDAFRIMTALGAERAAEALVASAGEVPGGNGQARPATAGLTGTPSA